MVTRRRIGWDTMPSLTRSDTFSQKNPKRQDTLLVPSAQKRHECHCVFIHIAIAPGQNTPHLEEKGNLAHQSRHKTSLYSRLVERVQRAGSRQYREKTKSGTPCRNNGMNVRRHTPRCLLLGKNSHPCNRRSLEGHPNCHSAVGWPREAGFIIAAASFGDAFNGLSFLPEGT